VHKYQPLFKNQNQIKVLRSKGNPYFQTQTRNISNVNVQSSVKSPETLFTDVCAYIAANKKVLCTWLMHYKNTLVLHS